MNEPLSSHLEQLRITLLKSLLTLVLTFFASLYYSHTLLTWVLSPMPHLALIAIHPLESLSTLLHISFIASLVCSLPLHLLYLYRFLAPALTPQETRTLYLLTLSTLLITPFAFYLSFTHALPWLLHWLQTLAPVPIHYTLQGYTSFTLSVILATFFTLESTVLFYLMIAHQHISTSGLQRHQKTALLVCAIVGAMITPPDIGSQVIAGLVLFAIYQSGIVLSTLVVKKSCGPIH